MKYTYMFTSVLFNAGVIATWLVFQPVFHWSDKMTWIGAGFTLLSILLWHVIEFEVRIKQLEEKTSSIKE